MTTKIQYREDGGDAVTLVVEGSSEDARREMVRKVRQEWERAEPCQIIKVYSDMGSGQFEVYSYADEQAYEDRDGELESLGVFRFV